jgi:hypothetical protein
MHNNNFMSTSYFLAGGSHQIAFHFFSFQYMPHRQASIILQLTQNDPKSETDHEQTEFMYQ